MSQRAMTIHDASAPNPKGQPTNDQGSAGSFWVEKKGMSWKRDDWYWWFICELVMIDHNWWLMNMMQRWWNCLQHKNSVYIQSCQCPAKSDPRKQSKLQPLRPKNVMPLPEIFMKLFEDIILSTPSFGQETHNAKKIWTSPPNQCSNISNKVSTCNARLKHLCVFGLPFGLTNIWPSNYHQASLKNHYQWSENKRHNPRKHPRQKVTRWHVTAFHCKSVTWWLEIIWSTISPHNW